MVAPNKSTPAKVSIGKVIPPLSPQEKCYELAMNASPENFARYMDILEDDAIARKAQSWHDAMRACQSEMGPISKDASNPQTHSRYASLGNLDAVLRPIYVKHGFDVVFGTVHSDGEEIGVTLRVTHEGGHNEYFQIEMPCDGLGIKGNTMMTRTHARGSAVTYGRRYLLTMAFNISTTDDDGNAATAKQKANENNGLPSNPEKTIGPGRAKILIDFAEHVGANTRLLCKYLEGSWGHPVNSFADIPESRYTEVVQQLERKRDTDKQKPQL